jgi:hypothetical protein
MEITRMFLHTSKAHQTGFGVGPKIFYNVNMAMSISELMLTVLHPVMFLAAKVYQAIVPAPPIRVSDTFRVYPPTNATLQRSLRTIRHDFRVDAARPFKQAKNDSFSARATASDTFDSACPQIACINLNFAGK